MPEFTLVRTVWLEVNVEAETLEKAMEIANGPDSIFLEEEIVDSTDWDIAGEEDRG